MTEMREITGIYRGGRIYLDTPVEWPDGMRVMVFRNQTGDEPQSTRVIGANDATLASRYFEEIREAWSPFSAKFRIIPFCTPVFRNPSVVVIGTNHSDFDPSDSEQSAAIADRYASGVLDTNTFVSHRRKFAIGLRDWCLHVGINVGQSWIGTNRCAVQTGAGGIDELRDSSHFEVCQRRMDAILQRLLAELAPRNIILAGKYAASLFYPNAESPGTKFVDLRPRDEMLIGAASTRLVPIELPSRKDLFRSKASERLAKFLVR